MGGLSQYLPSQKRLDFSFMFDASLGTLEATIHKNKKKWLHILFKSSKMSFIWSKVKQYLLPFQKNNH